MKNYNLIFISNEDLFNHVKETVLKYRFSIDLKMFNKNIIDPIKLTFDSKIYKKESAFLIEDEIMRQIDKSNTNHIGYFHQNIFKYLGNDWEVPQTGFDIINKKKKIYVEMKNKHNTMNSSSSQKTYTRMQHQLLKVNGSTCMLVEIIAKNSQNSAWNISLDGEHISNANIRRVSIDQFYKIVTGQTNAFRDLCQQLPLVIEDVIDSLQEDMINNSVFEELEVLSPNILRSLYLLSFAKYEGFENFEI